MSSQSLSDEGLLAGDTGLGSDHAPIVADFSVNGESGTGPKPFEGTLLEISPNPLRKSGTVRLQTPVSGPVSLSVFDASGRLVRTVLRTSWSSAGAQSFSWTPTNAVGAALSSGVYWVRLETVNDTVTERVVLTR